jgi:hypothetical protein
MDRIKSIEKNIEESSAENFISVEKRIEFQTYLGNHITKKFNLGGKFSRQYQELIFEKQKNIFEQLKVENKELPVLFYLNLNTLGLRCGKLKWIKTNLLDVYKEDKIQESFPENKAIYNLNMALYYLYSQQFTACDHLFSQINDGFGKNYNYKLAYYRLGIKLLFEAQNISNHLNELETKQNNFKQFISDNRMVIADDIRKPNLEFCNITVRISKNIDNTKKYNILKELEESTKPIADKEWLISIIEKPYRLNYLRQNIMKAYEMSNLQKVAVLCTQLQSKLDEHLSQKTKDENDNFLLAIKDLILFKEQPTKIDTITILSAEYEWLWVQKQVLTIKHFFDNSHYSSTDKSCNEMRLFLKNVNFEILPYEQFITAVNSLQESDKNLNDISSDSIERKWLFEKFEANKNRQHSAQC